MDTLDHDDMDALAARNTRLISHLDGALDEQMLHAMQGVWSMLEHAAADAPAHARAVRSRLFWESLSPGGAAAAPSSIVVAAAAADAAAEPDWDEASGFGFEAEAA